MSEITETLPDALPKEGRMARWRRQLTQNPVTVKELRSRMRGRRAFVVLTLYLMLMSAFVMMIYVSYAATSTVTTTDTRYTGKWVFGTMVAIQTFLVVFVGPAFTSGAISGEKERQTYDLLRTTLLSPRAFVLGKLLSALGYVFLLLFAALPLISLAFMLGGVALSEVVVSQIVLLLGAVTFALLGLYSSSLMRSTLAASVFTYAGCLFLTIGIPILVGIASPFFAMATVSGTGALSDFMEAVLAYGGMALVTTNLPGTLIATEVILLNYNSLWGYTEFFAGASRWMFSPWYGHLVVYSLLSYLLYLGTVRRVKRISRR